MHVMARWEPGAGDRLRQAALGLFTSRGFEQTTAAEIARAAGLTQRTFFRHFADKRDVLFQGQEEFVQAFTEGLDAAPPGASPLELVQAALNSAAALFPDDRRAFSRMRQSVIDANPPLQERERHKLAGLADEVAVALRHRGVNEPAATLAAESGSTVFRLAFNQWIREAETRSLPAIAAELLSQLGTLSSPTEPNSAGVSG
jgi:AcrR family transcriptional regulator